MPIPNIYLERRYGLLLSHYIIEITEYMDEFTFIVLTDFERFLLSELINIIFILKNFKIIDNMYVQLNETIDTSIFKTLQNCKSLSELCEFLDYKYDTFLFYSNKQNILSFMEKLKSMCLDEADLVEVKATNRPKRVNHIEQLLICQKNVTKGLSFKECFNSFSENDYNDYKTMCENILIPFNRPMSNILPYYYGQEYAQRLLSPIGFVKWEKEKKSNTYIITPAEIIHIEANRLVTGLDYVEFSKIIMYAKYKKQIWERYKSINNID